MRSQFTRILRKYQNLRPKIVSNVKCLTTTADANNNAGAAVGVREECSSNFVQESTLPLVTLPNADVFSYTLQHISKYQKLTATECGVTGRHYTYAQMLDGALRFATVVQKLVHGVKSPTVAFLTPNTAEYPSMFFGCMAIGAIVSPINPMYTPGEIASHLKDCGASVLVVDAMVEPSADAAFKQSGKTLPVIVNGESKFGRPNVQTILTDLSIPLAQPVDIDPSTTAFLPYSSGTTGKPKGVKLSHAAITNNISMYINDLVSAARHAEGSHQERYLGILPFFHIYGTMGGLVPSIIYGGKLVTVPMFEPNLFVSSLKKHKMTILTMVPPLLNFVAANPLITKEDLSELRSFHVGGAPVPIGAAKKISEKAPMASFQEGYGLTETLLTHITPVKEQKLGYCGRLLGNSQAKVIDLESGTALPANKKGELCLKVPSVMSGYHNNDEATREVIDEEGWFHTGDVAIYTEDGFFSIVDRIKELIKVKGLQVSPSEVEETLMFHSGIADAGVVGVPHKRYGEAPLAFIVKSDPSLTEKDIHEHIEQRLAKHKHLIGGIKFVDQLPKNPTGKLLRRVLKGMSEEAM